MKNIHLRLTIKESFMKKYSVSLRFMAINYDVLEKFILDKKIGYKIFRKGDPIISNSSIFAKENVLLINKLKTNSLYRRNRESNY